MSTFPNTTQGDVLLAGFISAFGIKTIKEKFCYPYVDAQKAL
jgi:predicted Co/Zn/Cd cation transporter (cation efflux family)